MTRIRHTAAAIVTAAIASLISFPASSAPPPQKSAGSVSQQPHPAAKAQSSVHPKSALPAASNPTYHPAVQPRGPNSNLTTDAQSNQTRAPEMFRSASSAARELGAARLQAATPWSAKEQQPESPPQPQVTKSPSDVPSPGDRQASPLDNAIQRGGDFQSPLSGKHSQSSPAAPAQAPSDGKVMPHPRRAPNPVSSVWKNATPAGAPASD